MMQEENRFDIMDATRPMLASQHGPNGSNEQITTRRQPGDDAEDAIGSTAAVVVDALGSWLNDADEIVTHLEDEQLRSAGSHLGSAVLRKSQEIADGIGGIAQQLEEQSKEERRMLAEACIQDLRTALVAPSSYENELALVGNYLESEGNESQQDQDRRQGRQATTTMFQNETGIMPLEDELQEQHEQLLRLQPGDMENLLQAATGLLRDVEDAFRSIDRNDADEIADVAVTLARLFLMSMQSIQNQLECVVHPQLRGDVANPSSSSLSSPPRIEIIDEHCDSAPSARTTSRSRTHKSAAYAKRLRILWPPLGPHVAAACQWGKHAALNRPLLTAALGLTLWPAAFGTAVVGGSLVVADAALQNLYNYLQSTQGPIMHQLECGAAQAWQAVRLSLLTGRLVTKQGVRVLQHQVDRQGGWPKVGHNIAGMAVDRVSHPIETIGMTWNAAAWGLGVVSDAVQHVVSSHNTDEEELAAQRLQ